MASFPKQIRITNESQLQTLFDSGKSISSGGITLKYEQDITIDAANRAIIKAENITFDAKDRILSHSVGWQILIGQCIRLHEPKTKLCPAFLKEYIDEQIKTLRTN